MPDRPLSNNHPGDSPPDASAPAVCPLCGSRVSVAQPLIVAQAERYLGERVCRQLGLYPLPQDLRLSVVVPTYNEKETVEEIIRRVRAVPIPKQIIIVDDGSTDGTADVLAKIPGNDDLCILRHQRNRGKGASLRTAFKHLTGQIVIIQDADLEYHPQQYPLLIQPIVEGVADVVYGSRFLTVSPHRVLYYWHRVANRLLTTLSNMFTDLNLTDMETCYKVFRREVIEAIAPTLKQDGFGIDPELTAKVARRQYRIYELGISYFGRTYREGKKIGLRDALQVFWCILRYWRWD
jgi:glycosyltransferase involved in cell wall biosynthesis